ncbi:hypothetical protein [Microbacterium sp.]|uniref:hypothetical protein n=1 Tax=Microbacterium sp. TaxID=51671 RepID=UPI0035657206
MTEHLQTTAPSPTPIARILAFLHRAWVAELRVYSSIARAIARRPAVPKGGTGIGYHRPVLTVLFIFISLSAVEIPILDLIVHQWPVVRITLLVLGIWGVTWMVGLLCAMLMRPHAVGPDGVRVRSGLELDVPIGWADIASIAISRRVDEPKQPRVIGSEYAERITGRDQHRDRTRMPRRDPAPRPRAEGRDSSGRPHPPVGRRPARVPRRRPPVPRRGLNEA